MTDMAYSWPMKAWCVCYRATDCPGGWIPYSGEIYWYKDLAEEAAAQRPNSKVKSFYVGPRATVTVSEVQE